MTDQGVRLGAVERREQLLGAARETFGANGFTATSMNDIAVAAGVTKPVLYQHFDSKHQLFLELLNETADALIDEIERAVAAGSTGREKLENAVNSYVSFFGNTPTNYQVLFGEGVRTEPEFAEAHRSVIDSFHQFSAEHIDIDTLDKEHRLLASTALAGQLEAVVGHWLEAGLEQPAQDIAQLLASLAWRGLRGTT